MPVRLEGARKTHGVIRLGATEARNLVDVLEEVETRHPDLIVREFGEAGPRGRWDIAELLEAVRRDLAAMPSQERLASDRFRYIWGYDRDGKVKVVHVPVRGGFEVQFAQE